MSKNVISAFNPEQLNKLPSLTFKNIIQKNFQDINQDIIGNFIIPDAIKKKNILKMNQDSKFYLDLDGKEGFNQESDIAFNNQKNILNNTKSDEIFQLTNKKYSHVATIDMNTYKKYLLDYNLKITKDHCGSKF